MRIPIERDSRRPIYRQIEAHIKMTILDGHLKVGTKLPSVRQMASNLNVNRITIETAYQLLEADGLIEKKVGSGTYVLPLIKKSLQIKDTNKSAWPQWQQGPLGQIKPDATNFQNTENNPDKNIPPINFAGGVGDPELFPIKEFGNILQKIIKRDGVVGLSYSDANGYLPLRKIICQIIANQGMQTEPENILITTGSQQAINLVTQLLLRPGDTVLTETPTYTGASDLFRAHHLHTAGIPIDEDGMIVDLAEETIQKLHPKLIYTIPNFQNPTGVCMSGKRRRQLIMLAEKYNIPILEDDYVGDLRYDGCALPTLKSMDTGGRVIYISTFSKMLMPDLRVGYIISEGPIYDKLVNLKCLNDLATPNLFQRALESYLSIGRYQSHLRKMTRIYKKRRECMLHAIKEYLPSSTRCIKPKGGLFVWIEISAAIESNFLMEETRKQGVGLGQIIQLNDEQNCYLRLNFAYQPEDNIISGMKRLGDVLKNIDKKITDKSPTTKNT